MQERRPIWRASAAPPRARLTGEHAADAVVIGAGMAGVLTAHRLARRGLRVIVLEARRVGSGQTGRTTAKITSQHGVCYDALLRKFGAEKAAQYARINERAIREYAALIDERKIDCDYRECASTLYSAASAEPMENEAEAARRLGIDARFTTDAALPFPVAGAVRFARQARFDPLRFLYAVAEPLEIYENSPVLDVTDDRAVTARGSVRADAIVFASHYPFVNVPGWYFWRLHQERSYVLALKSPWLPEGLYYGADADGLSFREANGLLLVGGENHRAGENSAGGRYERLLERARALLPGAEEAARWSAQDCVTLDGAPYVGAYAPSRPRWYVAAGFGKWGMTWSMAAAGVLDGLIRGERPEGAELCSPARFRLSASAKSLATETAQAMKGLTRERLTLPRDTLDALPLGHGGIVESEGRKAGVFKDEAGRCHIVSPRCPHLGCQLEWNPDERSWDCPCHGSRFDCDGALIDNPAQEGLR